MTEHESPLLLRVPEVARTLGIARSLAYEMARDGRLPTIHIGKAVRIPRQRLEAWIEERAQAEAASPSRGR
ncbi:MAG TPA: helix-turn-helix domain-containing protein [Candidatus Limnocylindrales bacterium]|jgi:excisionase family DNA binding protein|nr:helix-turn-helix domain-containing protein [Candidatus Limnocylindrales bacterium]